MASLKPLNFTTLPVRVRETFRSRHEPGRDGPRSVGHKLVLLGSATRRGNTNLATFERQGNSETRRGH